MTSSTSSSRDVFSLIYSLSRKKKSTFGYQGGVKNFSHKGKKHLNRRIRIICYIPSSNIRVWRCLCVRYLFNIDDVKSFLPPLEVGKKLFDDGVQDSPVLWSFKRFKKETTQWFIRHRDTFTTFWRKIKFNVFSFKSSNCWPKPKERSDFKKLELHEFVFKIVSAFF